MSSTNKPKFAVTYGQTDHIHSTGEGLETLFLSSKELVKELALEFIQVIPDELEPYQEEITNWDGKSRLTICHQDDDTFLFQATPISLTLDFAAFRQFVADNNAE